MSPKPSKGKQFKFKAKLGRFSPESGWHFIPVSTEICEQLAFPDKKSKRVVCTLAGSVTYQCALMPHAGAFFIMVNKLVRTQLGLEEGDPVSVELVRDESQYGLPMPEEFREVLDQDPDGDRMFHALTAGKQRSLLYAVGKVKDIDKRIHTCLIIIEHLRANDGKINGERLQEEIKRPIEW